MNVKTTVQLSYITLFQTTRYIDYLQRTIYLTDMFGNFIRNLYH